MPDKAKSTRRPTFRMPKRVFLSLWANNLKTSSDWKSFISNVWERFSPENINRDDNPIDFSSEDIQRQFPDIEKNSDSQYAFLSERVYQKCSKIRNEMKEAGFEPPAYPSGYLDRKGKRVSERLTPKDMYDIFNPE